MAMGDTEAIKYNNKAMIVVATIPISPILMSLLMVFELEVKLINSCPSGIKNNSDNYHKKKPLLIKEEAFVF